MKNALLIAAAAGLMAAAAAAPASASDLLYRNDFTLGADYLGAAVAASGYSVTATSGDLSAFNLSDYSVVVYANQNNGMPSGDFTALNAYIAAGGKVILDDWTSQPVDTGASYTGNVNLNTLTLGAQFSAGVGSTISVVNTGWGTYSLGLSGGTSAGTFENGDSGIVIGNSGRTITNGFLSDTVASQQLYANELGSFAGGAVPEPATWAMMLVGFGGLGATLRSARRRQAVAA